MLLCGKHRGEPEGNWDLFLSSFLIRFLRPSFRQRHLMRSVNKSNCFGEKLGRHIYLTLGEPAIAQRNTNLLLPQARASARPLWAPGNDPSICHTFGSCNCQNLFQDPAGTDLLVQKTQKMWWGTTFLIREKNIITNTLWQATPLTAESWQIHSYFSFIIHNNISIFDHTYCCLLWEELSQSNGVKNQVILHISTD